MAAHSYLRLGRRPFLAVREGYARAFAALFRDDERRHIPGSTAEDDATVEFTVPASVMRERLDVLGYNLARAQTEVARYCADEDALDRVDEVNEWIAAMVAPDDDEWPDLPPEPHLSLDGRWVIRVLLDAAPDDLEFTLDITEPVAWGLMTAPTDLCAQAFAEEHAESAAFGTLIVLTEGSTDTEFLAGALAVLRPHLAPYVRFLDYFSNRPEGGAPALVKAVKAFAAAGIGNRVVAVFDNDTGASEALTALDMKALPSNFRVVQLPPLDLARSYPTHGPTGKSPSDVNDHACSLEMYLGVDVLTDVTGELVPVQWTGYMSKIGRYHGELLDKRDVQERFRRKLAAAHATAKLDDGDWSGLNLVLDLILQPA